MKFRYYIANTSIGAIEGTNDETIANKYAASPDNFVVDTQTGLWLAEDAYKIEEAKDPS